MKRTLIAAIVGLLALTAPAAPKISWTSTQHNFGAFAEDDGTVSCEFTFTNTGDEPLAIVSARATCGCTVPHYSTKAVAPGHSGSITVEYNPSGRPGRFEKKIYIDTNTEPARSTLYISGTVVGAAGTIGQRYPVDFEPIRLRSGVLLMGEIAKGHIKSSFLEGYNDGIDTICPTVLDAPKYLEVSIVPEYVAPGEQFSLVAVAHTDRSDLYGVVEDSITIVADTVLAPDRIVIPTVAIFYEDFTKLTPGQRAKAPKLTVAEGDRLDLGRFSRSEQPRKLTATLRNDGKSKLNVRRIYGGDPAIITRTELNHMEIKPGRSATLTVEVNPAAVTGYILNERISIITNDPDHPTTLLRIVGEPTD